jgi:hypothetical protein
MKDIKSSQKPIIAFFQRFHLVIFTVVTVLILSTAILILSGIVNKASGIDSTGQTMVTNFDEDTINRINELKTSSEPSTPLDFSQGRINPFSE